MRFLVLIPWKPVVLVWALLIATTLVGFTASSVPQGTDHPVAPAVAATRSAGVKRDTTPLANNRSISTRPLKFQPLTTV